MNAEELEDIRGRPGLHTLRNLPHPRLELVFVYRLIRDLYLTWIFDNDKAMF